MIRTKIGAREHGSDSEWNRSDCTLPSNCSTQFQAAALCSIFFHLPVTIPMPSWRRHIRLKVSRRAIYVSRINVFYLKISLWTISLFFSLWKPRGRIYNRLSFVSECDVIRVSRISPFAWILPNDTTSFCPKIQMDWNHSPSMVHTLPLTFRSPFPAW